MPLTPTITFTLYYYSSYYYSLYFQISRVELCNFTQYFDSCHRAVKRAFVCVGASKLVLPCQIILVTMLSVIVQIWANSA